MRATEENIRTRCFLVGFNREHESPVYGTVSAVVLAQLTGVLFEVQQVMKKP